jgi:beta-lactamase regulating signal transducer with metallopeptidase domain
MAPAVDFMARVIILAAASWFVAAALRRRSASLRAFAWTMGLGGLLLMPVMGAVAPEISIAVLPASPAVPDPAMPSRPEPSAQSASTSLEVIAPPAPATIGTVSTASDPIESPARFSAVPVGTVLVFIWALVTAALVIRLVASHVRLARLVRHRRSSLKEPESTGKWETLIRDARAALGVRRAVAVRRVDALGVPAVTGIFRPVLLLPPDADEWPSGVRRAAVLHELAHVARRDALAQLVCQLSCAVYWFVPMVWQGARRAAALREQACDDVVLNAGVRPSAYAESLLSVASLAGSGPLDVAALAMVRQPRIRERIVAILDPRLRRDGVNRRAGVTLFASTAGLVAVFALVSPTARAAVLPETIMGMPSAAVSSITADATVPQAQPPRPPQPPQPPPAQPAPARGRDVQTSTVDTQPTASRICARGLDQSSTNINDNGTRRRWTVRLSGPGCTVDLRTEGQVDFNDDFTDVRRVSADGFFRLDVTDGGTRRQLDIEPRGGDVSRTWRVNGAERPYDAEARAWFAAFLIDLDRRTAVGVDIRLPHLLKQGGTDAVLAETALMTSDHPRGRYYAKLIATSRLSPAEMTRLLSQAASLTKSDHYADELIGHAAKAGAAEETVRTALFSLIDKMESDHYRANSIGAVMGAGRPNAQDMTALMNIVPRIKSDHYKGEVLSRILRGDLDPALRDALAKIGATIESDHYAAEFLKQLAGTGPMTAPGRQAFVEAAATIESDHYAVEVIGALATRQASSRETTAAALKLVPRIQSDHYRSEALRHLLGTRDLVESDLVAIVAAAGGIRSDHYKSESLRGVLRHGAVTERVRRDVLAAAESMSSHYRDEVNRAAGR